MKTIVIPKGTERITVAAVLAATRYWEKKQSIHIRINSDGTTDDPKYLHRDDSSELKSNWAARFLKFCQLNGVIPTDPFAPLYVEYTGLEVQKKTHTISIDELLMFARASGVEIVVDYSTPDNPLGHMVLENVEIPEIEIVDDVDWDDPPTSRELSKHKTLAKPPPNDPKRIPGKLPITGACRLAIKAAWEIECQSKRSASCDEIMKKLYEWADDGTESDTLIRADKANHFVEWRTKAGREKKFYRESCEKALTAWEKSR